MHRRTVPLAALAALAAQACSVQTADAKPLPTLVARATSANGAHLAKRVSLDLLDPSAFRVVRRSSSSVTLGWPARRPCAHSTFRLSLLPDQNDATAAVTTAVPSATRSGTSTYSITTTESDAPAPAFGAWREFSAITNSTVLSVRSAAAAPLVDRYGHAAGGLVRLTLSAKTITSSSTCAGPNQYRIGPGLTETIVAAPF